MSYKKCLKNICIVLKFFYTFVPTKTKKIRIMSYIDTRDLIEERDNLKKQILDDFNDRFNTELVSFDEIGTSLDSDGFKSYWEDEYQQIEAINEIEDEVGSEFEDGCLLIEEDDFEDHVKDMIIDCGYIPKDFPNWIEIDWSATSENVRQDYSELEYKGDTYYFRS